MRGLKHSDVIRSQPCRPTPLRGQRAIRERTLASIIISIIRMVLNLDDDPIEHSILRVRLPVFRLEMRLLRRRGVYADRRSRVELLLLATLPGTVPPLQSVVPPRGNNTSPKRSAVRGQV